MNRSTRTLVVVGVVLAQHIEGKQPQRSGQEAKKACLRSIAGIAGIPNKRRRLLEHHRTGFVRDAYPDLADDRQPHPQKRDLERLHLLDSGRGIGVEHGRNDIEAMRSHPNSSVPLNRGGRRSAIDYTNFEQIWSTDQLLS